uniref:Uncharacterized protein n=1 Tax=Acanthochromis polyacanthus TaxID=80966 RepID=A0A3Q1GJG9_9TELE
MSSLGEAIRNIILRALPSLSEEIQQKLVSTLESSGVECVDDLKYVQQEDIKELLPVIQQRKLLEQFKLTTSITLNIQASPIDLSSSSPVSSVSSASTTSLSTLSSPTSSCSLSSLHDQSSAGSASILKSWPETFQVPWDKMPQEIQTAISNGTRPAPDKRRQMVRILADEVRKYEANPTRSQCHIICQNITRQYPKTFADMTSSGDVIAGGFTSLLSQNTDREHQSLQLSKIQ